MDLEKKEMHWSVLQDHKMIKEGVQYQEKKKKFWLEDGAEISALSISQSVTDLCRQRPTKILLMKKSNIKS